MSRHATTMAGLVVVLFASPFDSRAMADAPLSLHAELDPLPFVQGGYGGQVGVQHPALGQLRLAVASFSLDVPDAAVQRGEGRDGFHARVRPSLALYGLYYLEPELEGWAFGAALRYLRHELSHDEEGDARGRYNELSPELIAAYKWHPFDAGFYLQPWLGLSTALLLTGEREVGAREYPAMVVQPFFTVNVGWQLR